MSSFDNEIAASEYETLASLAEDLVYRLPGCADLMIRKTIQSVYRDFCKRTCCLKTKRIVSFSSSERSRTIFAKTADCVIDCIVSVKRGLVELEQGLLWRLEGSTLTIGEIISPLEGEMLNLEVECVEMPKLGVETIPTWFNQKYGDAIESGVLARLMAMTGKAWSDPNQSALEFRLYENALTESRVRYMDDGINSAGRLNFIGRANVL